MNIQFLFEKGKGSVVDEYGSPEPIDYIVDEEQFRLETLSSHTQYLSQLPLESEKRIDTMQVEKEAKPNGDFTMRETSVKRNYTHYSDQDKVRFFKLLSERCLSAASAATQLGIHVHEVMKKLKQIFTELKVSKTTLFDFVRQHCNLSLKKARLQPKDRKSEEKIQERLDWIRKRKGTPAVVTVTKTRATTTTILGTISAEGLIKCSLRLPQPPSNKKRKRGDGIECVNKGTAQCSNAKAVPGARSFFHLSFAKANASCEFQIGLFANNGIWPSLAFFYWHRICLTQMYELVRVAHKTGQNRVIECAPELSFSDCIVIVRGSIGQLLQSKKKQKVLSTTIPNDAQWCLDHADHLSFKSFIETFDFLDRHRAQQRYTSIVSKYFNSNSERDMTINANYKTWTNSADYLQFWADLAGAELIESALNRRLAISSCSANENIHPTMMETNSVHQTKATALADSDEAVIITHDAQDDSNTNAIKLVINDDVITLHENTGSCKSGSPLTFKSTNVTQLFRSYQVIIRGIILKHQTLPIESYIHELAAHTHTLILCKNQHSPIAERVFSKSLLIALTTNLVSELVDFDLPFPEEDLFTLTTTLFSLALGTTTREQIMLDLYIMSSKIEYRPKRIKLPNTPSNNHDAITETELWSTYYDPVLSCLVGDPDKLVHLRKINSVPIEKGKARPDAVISEKPYLEFTTSIGFGEAKVKKRSGTRYSLCIATLRLITFCKNAIDVNKLDGAIALQIHGMHTTFFLMRSVATGLYTFVEIAHLQFADSVEKLPSFCTLMNVKKLLAVNNVFWRYCKESAQPKKIEARVIPSLGADTYIHTKYLLEILACYEKLVSFRIDFRAALRRVPESLVISLCMSNIPSLEGFASYDSEHHKSILSEETESHLIILMFFFVLFRNNLQMWCFILIDINISCEKYIIMSAINQNIDFKLMVDGGGSLRPSFFYFLLNEEHDTVFTFQGGASCNTGSYTTL
ncbi:hypothetical protein PHYBLDRAFT_63665 [Phycomyces blakesleeanus NRRL 1555(-)]|uniref:Homeodomain-like DNA binding domain-containing transcription factor n=1 Tax=Phycomyces blakesleeanus (strain ATCC 8743b / DSM 1359 / FGSC 10004 / NBRC 33097 / NRRL 1555) TaxID=763407 RepID=A0A162WIE6_PHYB8|nr:hypothetical protein PHYBLDRAFT_63665 [Phycomyces blakesleeanus NRRL 1555(-)]OAD67335.1 hypothetical protein PHYBLDRAFT_63665 [Phycomyces blakesleeanus NRRL 1555(-)]|eukprot:XP_018285375.1 hypothetical protein PHYBLDRAFT_63665 [Phycomyces blakesleeanus NRRL 1555(-)]